MKTLQSISGLLAAAAVFAHLSAQAIIVGPYSPDADTLHLWHLDEPAVPLANQVPGALPLAAAGNGATLGNPSFPGFGSAASTLDGGQEGGNTGTAIDAYVSALALANSTADNVPWSFADPVTGAFTFEAIVWVGFDPTISYATLANGGTGRNVSMQIITGETEGTLGTSNVRSWQFRLLPLGVASAPSSTNEVRLEFINVNNGASVQSLFATVPNSGPHAIVSNGWYHVAVTYNGEEGTPDNLKFYWTALDDAYVQANEIASTTMNLDLLAGPVDFAIGNTGRNPPNNNWLGLIDEVRISKVAREAHRMMFGSPEVEILQQPVDMIVAIGQPASFSVSAGGQQPVVYQWWHGTSSITDATNSTYSISSAQLADAGDYFVVVTNDLNSQTSAVVTLTVRTPLNLAWLPQSSASWNTEDVNWLNTANSANVAYTPGDNVTFDQQGSYSPTVDLVGALTPSSVTVDADADYTLTTSSGGAVTGVSKLTKRGTGTLIVDVNNSFQGPTTIEAGVLQIGNGGARGGLGSGPITNNAGLVISRSGVVNITDSLVGTGSLVNNTATTTVSGNNSLSGPVTVNSGTLVFMGPHAKGATTEYTVNASVGTAGTILRFGGGITIGTDTTISLLGSTASPDARPSLNTDGGTNVFTGPIIMEGDGNINMSSGGPPESSLYHIATPINSPGYVGQLILRGGASGLITSPMIVGNKVSKTDAGVWTIATTGNSWQLTDVAGGTLRLGVDNALPTSLTVNITAAAAVFDLGGFNQAIDTLTGPGIIANSSTTSDSTLTVHPSGLSLFSGSIRDSVAGGTRKVGLTVAGGELTLSGTNTYTGDTIIQAGLLELMVGGEIPNTERIHVESGATLSAVLRSDQTLTLNPGQTLAGNGAFNVFGSVTNNGTIELKLNKAGATLSNDSIQNLFGITYGGTLKLNITASPALTTSDEFPLFSSSSYDGAFIEIIPAAPAPGLAWDTSTLAIDGTLRITTSTVNVNPTNLTFSVSGGEVELSWPESHVGWRLQAQTNSINVGISDNWFTVPGSSSTNRVILAVDPANGTVFYRMVYP